MAKPRDSWGMSAGAKVRFFFYGELMKAGPFDAAARGQLRLREKDAAARFGTSPGTVFGQIHWVPAAKVKDLDVEEDPEYKRRTITLLDGSRAFAYEYSGKAWASFKVVADGKFAGRRVGH